MAKSKSFSSLFEGSVGLRFRLIEFVLKTLIIGILVGICYFTFDHNKYILILLILFIILQVIYYFVYLPNTVYYKITNQTLLIKNGLKGKLVEIPYSEINFVKNLQDYLERLLTHSGDVIVETKSGERYVIANIESPEFIEQEIETKVEFFKHLDETESIRTLNRGN